jgi:hypothetical protein
MRNLLLVLLLAALAGGWWLFDRTGSPPADSDGWLPDVPLESDPQPTEPAAGTPAQLPSLPPVAAEQPPAATAPDPASAAGPTPGAADGAAPSASDATPPPSERRVQREPTREELDEELVEALLEDLDLAPRYMEPMLAVVRHRRTWLDSARLLGATDAERQQEQARLEAELQRLLGQEAGPEAVQWLQSQDL